MLLSVSNNQHQNHVVVYTTDVQGNRLGGVNVEAAIDSNHIGGGTTGSDGRIQFSYGGSPAPVSVSIQLEKFVQSKTLSPDQNHWTFEIPVKKPILERAWKKLRWLLGAGLLALLAYFVTILDALDRGCEFFTGDKCLVFIQGDKDPQEPGKKDQS